jgi:hypothetical protein
MSKNHKYLPKNLNVSLLKPGDIVLFHSHGLFARGIRFVTDSYHNHAAIITRVFIDGTVGIIESSGHGVRPYLLHEYEKSDIMVLRPKEYTEIKGIKAMQMAHRLGKEKYDWCQISKFLFRYTLGRNYKRNAKLICSELVAEAWDAAGIHLFDENKAPTPSSIASSDKLDLVWGPNIG